VDVAMTTHKSYPTSLRRNRHVFQALRLHALRLYGVKAEGENSSIERVDENNLLGIFET
jgi:hypothetical protein